MDPTLVVLQWINAAAFTAVGLIAIRSWWQRRDAQHAALALAIGGLGVVTAIGRIAPLIDFPRWLAWASLTAFLLSGWGLLLFRHTVMPLSRRVRHAAGTALILTGLLVMAAHLPTRPGAALTPFELGLVVWAILLWSACVAEPAFQFFRAARGRAFVLKRRLRALSLGYVGMVLILMTALITRPDAKATASHLAFAVAASGLAPLMYASLSPPRWLRRRWRAREEGALREAVQQIVEAPDAQTAAENGLAWSLRILGAESGFIADAGGRVLDSIGFPDGDAARLASRSHDPTIITHRDSHLAVCPLSERDGAGLLAVASGPFSLVFGRDEIDTLRDLARTIAGAIERHALTTALRQESLRYGSLLNAISDLGVAVTMSLDGRIVSANDALCDISGYSRMEMLAMSSLFDVIPDEHQAEIAEQYRRFLDGEGDGDDSWDAPFIHKDGGIRHLEGASKLLDIDGKTHVLTIARDVTERTLASERDRRRAEQLNALARSSKTLASKRALDEVYPSIAAAAADVLGAAALVGIPSIQGPITWFDATGPAAEPAGLTGLAHVTAAEHRPLRSSGVHGVLNGSKAPHEALSVPILRRGQLLGLILLTQPAPFDDIDGSVAISLAAHAAEVIEGARALERERAMTRRLRELDDIKNSFLAAVSHELRTPLTSVLGFAHTLKRSAGKIGDEEQALLVERLTANAEKLGTLLTDLLDLDRLNRGIVEPALRSTDLSSLILHAIEAFDFPDARAVHVDVTPIVASVDGPKVERIIENLLSNAVRHTQRDTPIWVRAHREDGGVTIMVEDAGTGIPVRLRDRIFEPFQQGGSRNDHAPGVGIGLSLVAHFAELHGGKAWVTDRAGGGSSFRVWLPVAADHRTAIAPAAAVPQR